MPELPEMENYKILLNQKISGNIITNVIVNREKSINIKTEEFVNKIKDQKIGAIGRRAKHLLFRLENGYVLLVHPC